VARGPERVRGAQLAHRDPRLLEDLERAHDPEAIVGVDRGRGSRIHLAETGVERGQT
jgi:hypothetical protein